MEVTGDRYVLNPLIIEPIAGDDMCLLEFGEGNPLSENGHVNNAKNARNNNPAQQDVDDSVMNK